MSCQFAGWKIVLPILTSNPYKDTCFIHILGILAYKRPQNANDKIKTNITVITTEKKTMGKDH
jgi:hypothetical protein